MDPPKWHRTSYNVEGTRGVNMAMIKVSKDWNVKDTFAALALQKTGTEQLISMTPREALASAMALNTKNHETGTFV
jgi:hypothetical protein